MKILFLTPHLPYPPRQGTAIRNYNLLRHVARHHTVDLFSFASAGEHLPPGNPLEKLCERIEVVSQPARPLSRRAGDTLVSLQPDMALRLHSREAYERLAQLLLEETYDIIQAEGIEMAAYGLSTRHLRGVGKEPRQTSSTDRIRLVFDDHNAEYLLQKRAALIDLRHPRRWIAALYSLIQWQKLRRYERMVCRTADAVVTVSLPDRAALQKLYPGVEPILVPNGIDVDHYRPQSVRTDTVDRPTLVFTGKMDYRPNVDAVLWFANKVLPYILQGAEDVRFQVVGMNPHRRLHGLRHHPAIQIVGWVEDIRPYIRQASVYVVPMRVGGGTRFKVLEAMACGKALVSTSLGVEGIQVRHGGSLLVADSPREFARCVLGLLQDQQTTGKETASLGSNARTFVEKNYAWDRIVPRLVQLYDALCQ